MAASEFCPYYMIQYGDHFLSIQGHPEFSRAYIRDLILSRTGRIPQERIEQGLASLKHESDSELCSRWILHFIQS